MTVRTLPVSIVTGLDVQDQKWMRHGNCRGVDPDLFNPVEQFERDGRDRCRRAAATYCRPCPSRSACRRYAESRLEQGVWGAVLFQNRNGRIAVEPLLGAPARRAS